MNIILAAWDEGRLIGKDGGLPWARIKEDLPLFKQRTTDHAIIMGRKTFESFGSKPLPKRLNIVLSSAELPPQENLVAVKHWGEAFDKAYEFNRRYRDDLQDNFIIGGAQIYESALANNFVDKMIISQVYGFYKGDTYFPKFDESQWDSRVIANYEQFDLKEYVRK